MLWTWLGQIDARIWQALIAGGFVAVGWLVNGLRNRRDAARLRAQRRRDMQVALRAEIQHYVDALELFKLDDLWEQTVTRMTQDKSYSPVIPTEQNDTVFKALVGEVHILPARAIAPVVRYYNQVFAIDAIIGDLRADLFEDSNWRDRISMYTDYISLKKEALEQGRKAVAALDAQLSRRKYLDAREAADGALRARAAEQALISQEVRRAYRVSRQDAQSGGDQNAPATAQRVSNPGGDRSGRQSAGEIPAAGGI